MIEWATAYTQRLQPTLFRGKYSLTQEQYIGKWKDFLLEKNTFWGGEAAADLLTNYLQPEIWTLYTDMNKRDLVKELKLIPNHKEGNVIIYSPFWDTKNTNFSFTDLKTVHPLLVYAELINTMSSRNLETAQKIYEQYVKGIIE